MKENKSPKSHEYYLAIFINRQLNLKKQLSYVEAFKYPMFSLGGIIYYKFCLLKNLIRIKGRGRTWKRYLNH